MKNYLIFFLSLFLIISCQKETNENESKFNNEKLNSIRQVDCTVANSNVGFIRLLENREFENLFISYGVDEYTLFMDAISNLANDIKIEGLENFLNQLVLDGRISQLYKEYLLDVNEIGVDCNDALCFINSLISLKQQVQNSSLVLAEKNNLSNILNLTLSVAEVKFCDLSKSETRGFEDDQYCGGGVEISLADACGRKTLLSGGIIGAIVTVVGVALVPQITIPLVAAGVGGFIGGAITAGAINPANCNSQVCDECHHPESFVLVYDYPTCRIDNIRANGAFEFAEEWEWILTTISGETTSATTAVPRFNIPTSFNSSKDDFTVECWTVCDGGMYPATLIDSNTGATIQQDITGSSEDFDYNIPNQPWSLQGNSQVDDYNVFRFESTAILDNLINPVWSVDQAMIVDQGIENGRHFIDLRFHNAQNQSQIISLTLQDSCTGHTITRTITAIINYV